MSMNVATLEAVCTRLLPDEPVLAVGLFQPYGSMLSSGAGTGAGMAAAQAARLPGAAGVVLGAAGGLAGMRGMSAARGQPPFTVLAVTADHVYAFDASKDGGWLATTELTGPPYAVWDRSAVSVHVSRFLTHFHLSIDDHATGTAWEFKGNPVYQVGGKLVAALLSGAEAQG